MVSIQTKVPRVEGAHLRAVPLCKSCASGFVGLENRTFLTKPDFKGSEIGFLSKNCLDWVRFGWRSRAEVAAGP